VPGLEVAYQNFLNEVNRETGDPQWNIRHHPARKILDRYPPLFGEWVRHLEELALLKQAGYPFVSDSLSRADWLGLAILLRWQREQGLFTPQP